MNIPGAVVCSPRQNAVTGRAQAEHDTGVANLEARHDAQVVWNYGKRVFALGAAVRHVLSDGERLERATRRATVTPFKGDQQLDWVTQKYRYYYNNNEQLIWRTDDVSLIGVRDGKRLNTYADAFYSGGQYPWSGYGLDWTTYDDSKSATIHQGTCNGWTSATTGEGSFVTPDLKPAATELCGASSFILCVQQ